MFEVIVCSLEVLHSRKLSSHERCTSHLDRPWRSRSPMTFGSACEDTRVHSLAFDLTFAAYYTSKNPNGEQQTNWSSASSASSSPSPTRPSETITAMASHDLSESQTTFPSDSENYDANHSNQDSSDEPPSSTSSPMILYSPPTIWSLLRGAAINLLLPFVNGLMLGFGELFAHEAAFRLGWSKTNVS